MKKIGIIICDRYRSCAGGKCFRALRERRGGFAIYPADEPVEVVGFASCGGCPGGNIEYAPEEMKKNGADTIHLATGFVVGYPPCPHLRDFKPLIEQKFGMTAVIGTHPVPKIYFETHRSLPYWEESRMAEIAGPLLAEAPEVMEAYN